MNLGPGSQKCSSSLTPSEGLSRGSSQQGEGTPARKGEAREAQVSCLLSSVKRNYRIKMLNSFFSSRYDVKIMETQSLP